MIENPKPAAPDSAAHARMSGEDRRRQLIEVAIDLFARKGFSGTTTREIASAAGVTEAIIFRHFANKQDLYAAILDYIDSAKGTGEWLAEAQEFMDRSDDEGLFRLIITRVLEVHRNSPRFERLMLHAALEGNELALMHHNQLTASIGARVKEYIERRQKQGALRQANPAAILLTTAGMAHFYAMQKYMYQFCGPESSDEEMIDAFLAILMGGVRGDRAKESIL